MIEFTDDEVRAARAAAELARLYDAYQASSTAHVLVLERLDAEIRAGDRQPNDKSKRLARLVQDRNLAAETATVFAIRRAQLRRRLAELNRLAEIGGGD